MNKTKISMLFYMVERFIYKISKRSPIKFYRRKHYNRNIILSTEEGRDKIVELVKSGKHL